jgi:hypothetical protein
VIVNFWPPPSVTPDTVIVCPETATPPADAVVYPASAPATDGALHPLGTTTLTAPFAIPPLAAVYVNTIA